MTSPLTKIACALALLPAGSSWSLAGEPDAPGAANPALAKAADCLAKDQGVAAASLLERELPRASGEAKAQILALLEKAYLAAEKECAAKGQASKAKRYQQDAALVRQARAKRGGALASAAPAAPQAQPEQASAPTPAPVQVPAASPEPAESPLPPLARPPESSGAGPGPEPMPAVSPPAADPDPVTLPNEEPAASAPATGSGDPLADLVAAPASAPAPAPERPAAAEAAPASEPDGPFGAKVKEADEAFAAKDYARAGEIYGVLAQGGILPQERHVHWAYCRMAAVTKQINAGPSSRGEWLAIDREIEQIRALTAQSPSNGWFAQYLKDLADERKGLKPAKPGGRVDPSISRASAEVVGKPGMARESLPGPAAGAAAGRAGAPVGGWETWESPNFRILHRDQALAQKVAAIAEQARSGQFSRWSGREPQAAWGPPCEIVLYPTSDDFARETRQPASSPGFSTMSAAGSKITGRKIHFRADDPKLLDVHLPHEVTHVVIADFFPAKPLARWADEGIAVMSEPESEQSAYFGKAAQSLGAGGLTARQVIETENPTGDVWAEYYAKSASLAKFFLGRGTPQQFLRFLQAAQAQGWEKELRESYGIASFDDLQSLWEAQAKGG